jgi:Tfp pilus assembly protein PilN
MTENQGNSNKKYIIALIVLGLITIVLGILLMRGQGEIQTQEETISGLEVEQLQLQNDLQAMLIQYDTLTVENEQLTAEIVAQQEQIRDMLKQIEKHKDDAYIIAKLKKEAATLRDIMKGYLVTIDSLNTLNQDLQRNNEFLVEELTEAKTKAKQLETSKKDLEQIVATGSILQATDMVAVGIKVRSGGTQKEINRANKVDLIRACTKIAENRIASAGKKTVYLRIISPDGVILPSPDGPEASFDFEGVSGKYSIKRSFDYNNDQMDLCVFYTIPEGMELATGKYIVRMYESGALIGEADFDLK